MLTVLPRTLRGHALTGRSTRDTLHTAFKAVQRHRGAAGLDPQSRKMFAANLDAHLLALRRDRQSGTYQPIPRRRVYIPQGPGALRPWGIPPVRCRVAQEVTRALLAPLFAPLFHDRSHGFRRRRSCPTARAHLVEWPQPGDRGGGCGSHRVL
jgi:retron-type reverse transcriptase